MSNRPHKIHLAAAGPIGARCNPHGLVVSVANGDATDDESAVTCINCRRLMKLDETQTLPALVHNSDHTSTSL